jgi:hypothetical protein
LNSEILESLGEDRYFVVLQAFDFKHRLEGKHMQLLWETRFSLSQRGHDFGKDLPRMAQIAGKYFGQESHGLLMKPIPVGKVEIGTIKSLGDVPGK